MLCLCMAHNLLCLFLRSLKKPFKSCFTVHLNHINSKILFALTLDGGMSGLQKCPRSSHFMGAEWLSWGPTKNSHPGGQQNYVACGRQTLFMTDTVSRSPSLLTAPDFVEHQRTQFPVKHSLSDILVSREVMYTCFWQ